METYNKMENKRSVDGLNRTMQYGNQTKVVRAVETGKV